MKCDTIFIFLIATLVGCSHESTTEGLDDYVSFPFSKVKIRQPERFARADSFEGFGVPGTKSTILARHMGGPYAGNASNFTKERMAARGWTMLSKENVKVDDLAGILIHFEQPLEGEVFLKWCLIFGDDRMTTMVTATFPKVQERELSTLLKAAVLSTRPDLTALVDLGTDLPFTLVKSKKLELTPTPTPTPTPILGKTRAYTKDGVVPTKSPEEPLFIAAPALGKFRVRLGDRQKFADWRLQQTAATKNITLKTIEAITIDGLDGYESLAEAEDAMSGTPLLVYQAILYGDSSYILMQGLVGTALADEYLPEFKAMAHSLKRK